MADCGIKFKRLENDLISHLGLGILVITIKILFYKMSFDFIFFQNHATNLVTKLQLFIQVETMLYIIIDISMTFQSLKVSEFPLLLRLWLFDNLIYVEKKHVKKIWGLCSSIKRSDYCVAICHIRPEAAKLSWKYNLSYLNLFRKLNAYLL